MTDRAVDRRADRWAANPVLVPALGLSPLLAISTSIGKALGLALATLVVAVAASATLLLLRRALVGALRLPAWLLIAATYTAAVELVMQAGAYPLYQALGIFVPLIAVNGVILGGRERFIRADSPLPGLRESLLAGAGFALVLMAMGAVRETLGAGTLGADLDWLGAPAQGWRLSVLADHRFPLLLLPPGAFLLAGLALAVGNHLDARRRRRHPPPRPEPGAKRVRPTGAIR